MRHAAVTGTVVGVGDPQRGHRPTIQRGHRVDRFARAHTGESPSRSRAQIAWPLRDDDHLGLKHQPGGEQAGVQCHRFHVTAECLPHRHRADEEFGVAQPGDGT